MACQFPKNFVDELRWVSEKLLSVINVDILIGSGPGDGSIDCNLPGNTNITSFDCGKWCSIRAILSNPACQDTNEDYLQDLIDALHCVLSNVDLDYGIKAQIKRFKCLVEILKVRINSIACVAQCEDIIGDLLCILIQVLTALISAVSKVATMVYYADCYDESRIAKSFIDCISCDFVNDLCELERLLDELIAVANAFNVCFMDSCTPCTVAPSVPPKRRPVCPPPMMHGGHHGPKSQYNGSCKPGCGCN